MRAPLKLQTCAVSALLILASQACLAAPLVLNCKTDSGTPTPDLIVDLDNHTMGWGPYKFDIRGVTDRYITGIYENSDHVGAEVWVLDRTTGEYRHAGVSMTLRAVQGGLGPPELTSYTYRGTCARPLV
jgi:hypothetical protein